MEPSYVRPDPSLVKSVLQSVVLHCVTAAQDLAPSFRVCLDSVEGWPKNTPDHALLGGSVEYCQPAGLHFDSWTLHTALPVHLGPDRPHVLVLQP